ncbi:MAG: 50S ribosomal protein L25/general stress protein Ctc [Bacteroidales bacterium]|nr:50S ribosomal protein L25/general stress protein Ctc [Bacteroidales bacterium]
MKSIEIKAELRKEIGKKHSKALRRKGLVPCVMYGEEEVMHLAAPENEFRHIIYTHDVYLIKLNIEGKIHQAILQDIQFHPVTDHLLHIDFIRVFDNKPAIISLPVVLTGSSVGIREGGKLRQRRRYLKVKGLVKDMPDNLIIDITDLKIGDFIKVETLQYDNLELLDPARAMVVGVSTSRIAKGMEEAVPEVEEEAEAEEGAEEGAEEKAEGTEKATDEGGDAPADKKSEG